MTRLLIALALTAPCLALSALPARAQTVVDRCTTDVEPGGSNLADALNRGGLVTFACPDATTIQVTRPHPVSRSVELDGGGKITLDGGGATPFIEGIAPDLTIALSNITIRRMSSTNTSGVVDGDLGLRIVITNSQILQSELPIAIVRGEVIATDSLFEGNGNAAISAPAVFLTRTKVRATEGMPILSRSGQVSITDGEFADNKTGSVFRECSQVTIVRTSFINNELSSTGDSEGGAAFRTTCDTSVENGTFTGNKSGAHGGAIHVRGSAKRIRSQGSRFTGNSAGRGGGAISFEPATGEQEILIQHTIFKGNTASSGGAVSIPRSAQNGTVRFTGRAVTFAGNSAGERGGALSIDGAMVTLLRAAFIGNAAPSGAAAWVSAPASGTNSFANALFVLNSGPGGAFTGSKASFINSTLLGTTGPGLVQAPAGPAAELRLANSVVENNSGGNCVGDPAGFINDGANLQFPGSSCGAGITVAAALLDTFYAPMIGGAARANGRDDVCANSFVRGRDFYGKRRPQSDHCSIGAVEGDMRRTIEEIQAWRPKPDAGGECRPSSGSACECPAASTTVSVSGGSTDGERRLAALGAIGIDFSVAEVDLKSWLDTPDFTPYPAIADALLQLTQVQGFKCPIFIDVIVFNYENTPGVTSPRRLADVKPDVLRAAVLEGYNNRHGTHHSDFQDLIGANVCVPSSQADCSRECLTESTAPVRPVNSGSTPAEQRIASLAAVGVDFSVPEADLKSWLADPEFTPYPAISDALLELTRSRGLKCPVFIDVIVFNYEGTSGVTSPRKLADVNFEVLQAAVVEGYNSRHGTHHRTIAGIINSRQ